jgi:uncharacterized protein (DUF433 family)
MLRPHKDKIDYSLYGGEDPRELPTYTISEAAHYLRIPLPALRSWIRGRRYPTTSGKREFQPVITLPDKNLPLLSFVNLVEAHILDAIRYKHKIPLPNIRRAIKYLQKMAASKHPLADYPFKTPGLDLFIEESGLLINVSRDGQLEMREIIQAYLERVERDPSGTVARLYPFLRKRHPLNEEEEPKLVVIDPLISFGKPVLAGAGIPTSVIAERFNAGERIDEIARDYALKKAEIEEAIRYEYRDKKAA